MIGERCPGHMPEDDTRSGAMKPPGNAEADARRGPGNHRDLPIKTRHRFQSSHSGWRRRPRFIEGDAPTLLPFPQPPIEPPRVS